MRPLWILLALLLAIPVSWAGYQVYSFGAIFGLVHDDHEWRQKLTVEVQTPGGPRRGSAVVQVNARFFHGSTGNEVTYQTKGEATVVEVAPGQYLFALIGGADERFYAAARDRFDGMDRGEWLYEIPKQTEPVALTGGTIPLLVTFTDINDPTTVTRVDPANLTASFGPGVSLTAVTLEVTEDPVTEGRVEGVLGWLVEAGMTRFNVAKTPEGNIPLDAFLSIDHWSKQ